MNPNIRWASLNGRAWRQNDWLGILLNWEIQILGRTRERKTERGIRDEKIGIGGKWKVTSKEHVNRKGKVPKNDLREIRRVCEKFEWSIRRNAKTKRKFCISRSWRYGTQKLEYSRTDWNPVKNKGIGIQTENSGS